MGAAPNKWFGRTVDAQTLLAGTETRRYDNLPIFKWQAGETCPQMASFRSRKQCFRLAETPCGLVRVNPKTLSTGPNLGWSLSPLRGLLSFLVKVTFFSRIFIKPDLPQTHIHKFHRRIKTPVQSHFPAYFFERFFVFFIVLPNSS